MPEAASFCNAPMLFAALMFAGGEMLAHLLWRPPALLLAAVVLGAVTAGFAAQRAPRIALLPMLLTWLLLGDFSSEIQRGPTAQTALGLIADSKPRILVGEVERLGPVRIEQSKSPYSNEIRVEHVQQIDLAVDSASNGVDTTTPIRGGVRLTIFAPLDQALPRLGCGDALQVMAPLHKQERFLDPGVWDGSAWLLQQGIGALGSTAAAKVSVVRVAPRRWSRATLPCRVHSLQEGAGTRLIDYAAAQHTWRRLPAWLRLSSDDAAMLTAMVTGDRSWLQHHLRVGFERTGSFHLLVVSGMHLAIFVGCVFMVARRLRLSFVWASLATIPCAFGYALFTGFGQPVQRSFWMVTLFLIGRLLWRERRSLNAIGFAALCLLAANPSALFDSGFQMTLLSVIAIAGIAAPIAQKTFEPYMKGLRDLDTIAVDLSLPPRVAQFRVSLRLLADSLRPHLGRYFADHVLPAGIKFVFHLSQLLLVSVTMELVMSLPMALYFHRITVMALPVNVLIVPLLSLLLPCALLTFAGLMISPAVAALPAAVTAALLHMVSGMVHFFSNMSAADFRIPGPTNVAIAGWVALIALAIWLVRRPRYGIWMASAALAMGSLLAVLPRSIDHRAGALEITAIDVGQGDSLLLITPEGRSLLIDGGGLVGATPDSNFDIGEDVVSPVLWSRGIRRLDAVVLTHAHADHIGGLHAVFDNFRPRKLWIGHNPTSESYGALLAQAGRLGTAVRSHTAGEQFSFGSVKFEVLAPEPDYQPKEAPGNNDSLVLRAVYGKTSALLEGDAEFPSEARMIARGGLRSDFLKVGHHGSRTSSTPAFLAAVSPSVAAISVGQRNTYGHPRMEILQELQSSKVLTYRTDALGATTFYLDGTSVSAGIWASTRR
jgi:competence protein ComEC